MKFSIITICYNPGEELRTAIESLRSQTFPLVHYIIVGDILETNKQYYKQLQDQLVRLNLTDRVHFLGKRDDIGSILNVSNVFLLSSFAEGTPLSILEAMAMKVPVIATNVGGIPDEIEDNKTGYLVPPGDIALMAKRIQAILMDDDLANKLTLNAERKLHLEFSMIGFISSFSASIRNLVNS